MKNIAIDSDIFIASEIENEPNHKESKRFIEAILKNNLKFTFYTSIFTFLELASAMTRRINKDKAYSLLYRINKTWKKSINPLPISKIEKQTDMIDELAEIAIQFGTKSGDSIQIQSLSENNINCFITWNKKDFTELERQLRDFRVLTPTEFFSEVEKQKKNLSRKEKTKSPAITAKDLLEILKVAKHKHHKFAYMMGWYSGLKISEILNLEPRDIDMKNGTVLVRKGKEGTDRTTKLCPFFRKEMFELMPLKKLVKARALQKAFKKDCSEAGILKYKPSVRFHSLRAGYFENMNPHYEETKKHMGLKF